MDEAESIKEESPTDERDLERTPILYKGSVSQIPYVALSKHFFVFRINVLFKSEQSLVQTAGSKRLKSSI